MVHFRKIKRAFICKANKQSFVKKYYLGIPNWSHNKERDRERDALAKKHI